jgi:hypothetical protein
MRKIIISVVLVAAFLFLLAPATYAAGGSGTTVTISGTVSLSGFGTVSVRAHASGITSSLSGGGTDSPPPNIPPGNPAVCQWPLTGSVSGSVVMLVGTVTQSSVRAEIGTPITLTADASTGAITWTFGGFPLTGTGTVEIRTG